jgi:hypothetical protein
LIDSVFSHFKGLLWLLGAKIGKGASTKKLFLHAGQGG